MGEKMLPWTSLLNRWPPSDEVLRKVATLVKDDLEGRVGDKFAFGPIVVIPKIDYLHEEDEYLHVYVVYEGEYEDVDVRWMGSLDIRIGKELDKLGIVNVLSQSYIPKFEWDEDNGDRVLKRAKRKFIL